MGESTTLWIPGFNKSLKIESRPERLTGDAGVLLLREALERLGIVQWLESRLQDPRAQEKVTHPLAELLRTSILLAAQGWGDQDDADALRHDPVFRLGVSSRRGASPLLSPESDVIGKARTPDGLASQPTLSRMVGFLSPQENRATLRKGLLESSIRRILAKRSGRRYKSITLDVDSLPVEVEGNQKGSAYNPHYHTRIYHPLVASLGLHGDIVDVRLREGQVHTADGDMDFILPLVHQLRSRIADEVVVRIDAGFPDEKLMSSFENQKRPVSYVARLKNNKVLDRMAQPHLVPPEGAEQPDGEERIWFKEMTYRAASWSKERRVVLVVQKRSDELFPHYFWLLTSFTNRQVSARELLTFYRGRGSAESLMGEWMDVLQPALSSTNRTKSHYRGDEPQKRYTSQDPFDANEVTLLLSAYAYNLLHTVRVCTEAATKAGWSIRRVQERILKAAARVLLHSRRVHIVVANTAASLWERLLSQVEKLVVPVEAVVSPPS